MHKTTIFLALWILTFQVAFKVDAQQTKIALLEDSLKTTHDTLKFAILEDIADELYFDGKLKKSADKYREARIFEENSQHPDLHKIARSYGNEGFCFYEIGYYDKAIELYYKALNLFQKVNDSVEIASYYSNIGIAYFNLGNYNKSIQYFNDALKIDTAIHDIKGIGYDYSVIGNVYSEWAKFDDAIDAFKKSLVIAQQFNDSISISIRLAKIGSSFIHLNEYDSALTYLKKSLLVENQLKNNERLVIRLNQIANLYYNIGDYRIANNYYKQAIEPLTEVQQLKTKAIVYSNYGRNCLKLKQYNLAQKYLFESNRIAKSINLNQTIINNYQYIAQYFNLTGQYKQAYNYQLKHNTLKDSAFSKSNQDVLSKFQARFQTQEKEAVIKDLMQQQQLQDLQLTNEKNRRNFAILIAFFALLAFVATIFIGLQIRSKNNELTNLNSTLKRMFSIISHDLRGAIASYQATGRILKHHIKKNQVDKLPELADEVSKNSQQLSAMLDNLLNWSLSQIRNKKSEPNLIDIYEIIKNEQELYHPIAEQKNTCLVNQIEPETYAFADREHLQLIFRNLISNAIKFTENGTIELSCNSNHNFVYIKVKDTGIGIKEQVAKQIFDINEKKINRGTRNEKGTGLGLNLVKDYVELNNGTINFESKLGEGTEFIIKLPANNTL